MVQITMLSFVSADPPWLSVRRHSWNRYGTTGVVGFYFSWMTLEEILGKDSSR